MKHFFGTAIKCSDILLSLQAIFFAFIILVLWCFCSNIVCNVVGIKSEVVDVLDFGAVGDGTVDRSEVNSVPNPIFITILLLQVKVQHILFFRHF